MMQSFQQTQNPLYVSSPPPIQNQFPQQIPFQNTPGQPQVSFLSDHDIQRITSSLHESLLNSITTLVNAAVTKHVEPLQNKILNLEHQVTQITDQMNKMKIDQDIKCSQSIKEIVVVDGCGMA